jgi:hypothetical protein
MIVMEKIRIKCPVCGAILEAEDNPANYEKYVRCPNCKARNRFSSFQRIAIQAAQDVDSATEIRRMTDDTIGFLLDLSTGQKYPLKEGRNLIGRMTYHTPPQASVPIVTENRRMSRSHLNIDVIRGADGRYHAYASNASNQNPTTINGILLEDGDALSLKDQDVLSLSDTKLIYSGSRVNDETEIHVK